MPIRFRDEIARLTTTRAAAALVAVGCLVAGAWGDVLVHQTFEEASASDLPVGPQPVGTIVKIETDAGDRLGSVTVAKLDTPKGPNKVAEISNVAHKENRAPGLGIRWTDPDSGVVRVEYRFMTPIDGPFLSSHYFGGDWKTGATIFMVGNGRLTVQYGENEARLALGTYKPNTWYTVRFDFDVTAKTIDLYLDGQKLANQLPWQPGATGIGRANLLADFTRVDHAGAPVLYVDDITVESVAPVK